MFVRTVASLFGAVLLGSAVHAATVEEFKAEDWDGLAFTSDATGDFTHCSVYATYKNGATLYISYEVGDSWYFSVANDAWKLDQGGSYPISSRLTVAGRSRARAARSGRRRSACRWRQTILSSASSGAATAWSLASRTRTTPSSFRIPTGQ
jgi:hypothetical protein